MPSTFAHDIGPTLGSAGGQEKRFAQYQLD